MYILWSLINTAFVILFFALVLTLFSKGRKLFCNKYGNLIIVIFVIGVLGMLNAKDKEFKNTYVLHHKPIDSATSVEINTNLEESFSLRFHLSVLFKKDAQGKFIPISSGSMLDGFISGYQWEYKNIAIESNDDGTFSYKANGLLYWHLFGMNLYTQNKDFTGTFTLEEY